ncbi:MAG: hypothetical protein WKG07_02015 [Hymenobacter sp.]
MELSHRAKAAAIQHSIELGPDGAAGLVNPTRYRQHNPLIGEGRASIEALHAQLPHGQAYVNVVRAFQDGDFGFVHVDYHLFEPTVAFDIHRFENGVSVEHWDGTATPRSQQERPHLDRRQNPGAGPDKTESNKALARRFTQEVLVENQFANLYEYFAGEELMQHNPHMGDGVAELLAVQAEWERQGTPPATTPFTGCWGRGTLFWC